MVDYTVPYKTKWTLLALLFLYIEYPGDYPLTGRFRVHGWELSSRDRRAQEKFLQDFCGTSCPLEKVVSMAGSSHTQNGCNARSWEEYRVFVKQIFARPDHRLTSSDRISQVLSPACATDMLLPQGAVPYLLDLMLAYKCHQGQRLPGSHQQTTIPPGSAGLTPRLFTWSLSQHVIKASTGQPGCCAASGAASEGILSHLRLFLVGTFGAAEFCFGSWCWHKV